MNRLKMLALDCLYPNRCGCCGSRLAYDRLICAACEAELKEHPAEYCEWANQNAEAKHPWDAAAVAFQYEGAAKSGVLAMKDGCRNFAAYAGAVLADRIRAVTDPEELDCVTWVPITKKRRRIQGYCHAELLARAVASSLHVPVRDGLLTEQAGRVRQHQVSGRERTEYAGRFHGTGCDLTGQTILLCDDVLTSGSTLRQCTSELKADGAARVIIAAATVRLQAEQSNAVETEKS